VLNIGVGSAHSEQKITHCSKGTANSIECMMEKKETAKGSYAKHGDVEVGEVLYLFNKLMVMINHRKSLREL
jgi:hypothetical protein